MGGQFFMPKLILMKIEILGCYPTFPISFQSNYVGGLVVFSFVFFGTPEVAQQTNHHQKRISYLFEPRMCISEVKKINSAILPPFPS